MPVSVHVETGRHTPLVAQFFEAARLDAFHDAEILSVVFGAEWRSVLVTDGTNALLSAIVTAPIGTTGLRDIDPFLGYAGPVSTTADKAFLAEALVAYAEWCRGERIVAEVARFSPILENHRVFTGTAVDVVPAKEIVVAECHDDEAAQLATFSKSCRASVKRGLRDHAFEVVDKNRDLDAVVDFYHRALDRLESERRWYFSPEFFGRVQKSSRCVLYRAMNDGRMISAAMAIHHSLAAYYFLAANDAQQLQGANELVVYGICRDAAARGAQHLIMGGGHKPTPEDALFRFKGKFATDPTPFHIGRMVHDPVALAALKDAAVKADPGLKESRYFLSYRLGLYR
ncbi:MAG: GNAT family N-acetyltransferase [Rhodospirillales bacterium]|nr:GNAT family N-acetyltransferase [Rhodospirillales bacterium]